VNIKSSLTAELRDKSYRDAYVASQIRIGLPYQARALRVARDLTQGQLADLAEMAQPRIAEIEKPGKRSLNLETLLRLASAFDVGLEVRFVPFGDIVRHEETFDPDTFDVPSFDDELLHEKEAAEVAKAREESLKAMLEKLTRDITDKRSALNRALAEMEKNLTEALASRNDVSPIRGASPKASGNVTPFQRRLAPQQQQAA
jgi:transcriptional regulator with XRE-family HTH domain